jgi:hypothetical protein
MMLRRIFGPKRDEVTGERRKIHNKEANDLCSSPIIFCMNKSRRMRWAGQVARLEERRGAYKVLVVKPEERAHHLKDPSIDGRIILRWMLRNLDGGHGLD